MTTLIEAFGRICRCKQNLLIAIGVAGFLALTCQFAASQEGIMSTNDVAPVSATVPASTSADPAGEISHKTSPDRLSVLIVSLTVFVLAIFIGFEVINKVPPTLHTPLMSGSNAISGITVVGAILAAGFSRFGFGTFLGTVSVVFAMINVVGGFWVTHRMLAMFKKK